VGIKKGFSKELAINIGLWLLVIFPGKRIGEMERGLARLKRGWSEAGARLERGLSEAGVRRLEQGLSKAGSRLDRGRIEDGARLERSWSEARRLGGWEAGELGSWEAGRLRLGGWQKLEGS
jgi:hypothetical protein